MAADKNFSSAKILLVDDEKDFAETLGFWLEAQGFKVVISSSGREAIEIIKKDKPDIVFLDVIMPEMDGIETLRAIRKFDRDMPVIMNTAYTTDNRILAAEMLGVAGFFRKSSDFAHVTKMIEAALTNLT